MQQVAAHKTDIAALPFSASGTAKAVGTGIGTQQQANNENNQAFNRLYQDAKTTKSDFVLNEKEDQLNKLTEDNLILISKINYNINYYILLHTMYIVIATNSTTQHKKYRRIF